MEKETKKITIDGETYNILGYGFPEENTLYLNCFGNVRLAEATVFETRLLLELPAPLTPEEQMTRLKEAGYVLDIENLQWEFDGNCFFTTKVAWATHCAKNNLNRSTGEPNVTA